MRGTSVIPAQKGGCRRRLLCDYATSKVSQEASIGLPRAFCCHVLGPLVVPRLERTFCALVLRHAALRSTFPGGVPPVQVAR